MLLLLEQQESTRGRQVWLLLHNTFEERVRAPQ